MRYHDTGEVHKDFHLATNQSIEYIMRTYGQEFLAELCRRTAQLIYRDIYRSLQQGDSAPLLEHLEYYLGREGGEYQVIRNGESGDGVTEISVVKCPMLSHIVERGNGITTHMSEFLSGLYGSWGESTPFSLTVEYRPPETGYTITLRRRHAAE